MSAAAGSIRAIVKELLRLYGLWLAIWVPLAIAVLGGVVTALLSPGDLADNAQHAEWTDLFGTSGQIIATLLVALVVEARAPFTRSGELAVRVAAGFAALMLGGGGLAAIAGLSPSLPGCAYSILLGFTVGGAAGGFTAVVMLGVIVAVGTLRRVDEDALAELKQLGDPSAAEELFRRRGL